MDELVVNKSAIGFRRWITRSIQFGLTILAVCWVAYIVDWRQFTDTLQRADWGILALAYALFLIDRVLMSYKWGLLLAVQGIRVPLWENWSVYSLAGLSSMLLPATIGADAFRVLWLWRRGAQVGTVTASIVLERVIGFAVSLSMVVVSLIYLASGMNDPGQLELPLFVVLLTLVTVIAALVVSFRVRIEHIAQRYLRGTTGRTVTKWIGRFHDAYQNYRSQKRTIITFTCLTFGELTLTLLMGYVIAVALDIPIGAIEFCAAFAVAMLIARLPVTIDGIGVFEGVLIFFLMSSGVHPTDTVAFAIVGRIMNIASFTPGAIATLALKDLSFHELRSQQRIKQ